jgi:isocitrate dehydrogenase kinase/phosphatase
LNRAYASASLILEAYETFQSEFKSITHRTKGRFERRDWHGARLDAIERLGLYKKVINQIVGQLEDQLCNDCRDIALWEEMKTEFTRLITGLHDFELAETFFNSVTRRIFITVGVDARIEYVDMDFEIPIARSVDQPGKPVFTVYSLNEKNSDMAAVILATLEDHSFDIGYQDIEGDARLVSKEIENHITNQAIQEKIERVEVLHPIFYRDNYAFLIGRLVLQSHAKKPLIPLAIALVSTAGGVSVDAALLDEDQVSIVFSFAHSYFHVEAEKPFDVVRFLKSIIPLKRIAELYISIGYNKHGKTELRWTVLRLLAAKRGWLWWCLHYLPMTLYSK